MTKTILFASEYCNFRRDMMVLGKEIFGEDTKIEIFDNCDSLENRLKEGVENLGAIIVGDNMGPNKKEGEYIIEKYRKNRRGIEVPSFFLVCKGTDSDGERAIKLGANDYLTTPCNLLDFGPMFKEHYEIYVAQKKVHTNALYEDKIWKVYVKALKENKILDDYTEALKENKKVEVGQD